MHDYVMGRENRQEFADHVLQALRAVPQTKDKKGWAEGRGDPYFPARQRVYFLNAFDECKCDKHTCTGCWITLTVANALAEDVAKLNPEKAAQEEEIAREIAQREWSEHRRYLHGAEGRARRLEEERKAKARARFTFDPEKPNTPHWQDEEKPE